MEGSTQLYFNVVLLGLLTLFTGAGGLRDVVLRVPLAIPSGTDVSLLCLYDLEGDQLYTVKWYKGKHEFFRYVPKELPHTRVFALPGISVDVMASGMENVVLRNVQRSLTGKYRCEVSTDAPDFHTEVVSGYMNVVDKLVDPPEIRLEKSSYSIGDTLRGNCTSPPYTPPPNITWYINGVKVEDVDTWLVDDDTTTIANLSVDLSSGTRFPAGKLSLICVADLFSITKTSKELWLAEDHPRLASVLGNWDSAASSDRGPALLLQIALIAVHICCWR